MTGTRSRLWRALCLTGYLGTFGLLIAWLAWLAPTGSPLLYLLLLGPLLAMLPGMWGGRRYPTAVGLFLSLVYFTHGVMEGYSEPGLVRALGLAEVGLSLLWFAAGILYIRGRD